MRSCRYELRRSDAPGPSRLCVWRRAPGRRAHTRPHARTCDVTRTCAHTNSRNNGAEQYGSRTTHAACSFGVARARRAGSRVPLGLAAAGARRAAALELVLLEGHVGEGELLVVGGARGARRGEGRAFREEDALPAYWKDRRLGDFGGASRPHHRSLPLRGPERLSCDSCSPRVRAAAKSMGSQPGRRAVALST